MSHYIGQPRSALTDLGNSERFGDDHCDGLRLGAGLGWLAWKGTTH